MFVGADIKGLVWLLEARAVPLYHACQLTDLHSYLALEGIPSRALLSRDAMPYTSFETDRADQANDVWDKVFLNLSDFGEIFATGRDGIPNAYGPIQMLIQPQALLEAEDVAICLRSASGHEFNREGEALTRLHDVDRLFKYPVYHGFPHSAEVRYGRDLEAVFADAMNPEISCSFPTSRLSLEYVSGIVVDPYTIQGDELVEQVSHAVREAGLHVPIHCRTYSGERLELLDTLCTVIDSPHLTLKTLIRTRRGCAELSDWAGRMHERGKEWLFQRYVSYLYNGTILPILRAAQAEMLPEHDEQIDYDAAENEAYHDFDAENDILWLPAAAEPYSDLEDDDMAEEIELIREENAEFAMDWHRSSDSGWFYDD